MTANRTIHCSCGEVFSERGHAETHARLYCEQPDAHTIVEETPVPHAEAVDIAMAATASMLRAMGPAVFAAPEVAAIEAVAREVAGARVEMMRHAVTMERASVELEAARSLYELARGKVAALDKQIDTLAREICGGAGEAAT